jgi:hypothetical protein
MKNFLLGIALISGFAACKSKETQDVQKDLLPLNPAYSNSILSDTGNLSKNVSEPETEQVTYKKRVKKRIVYYDEPTVVNTVPSTIPATNNEVVTAPVPVVTDVPDNGGTGNSANTSSGDATSGTASPAKKKGWSNSAKGAVIGAVGGAVAGAVINGKNRGKGAVIGGVIGAAGGYILGKKKDKKDAAQFEGYGMQ